jgi:hypothetical protein
LRRAPGDFCVDRVPMGHLGGHQLASQLGRIGVACLLCQVALQDRIGRALAEVRFEHRRQSQAAAGSASADAISPRHHRPGR